jgi:5-(carboxyamino)imidazole ribonucleotide synthase
VDVHQKKIGILGGGQLGKMLAQSALSLGLHIRILDQDKSFPAGAVCRDFLEGDFKGYDDVLFFGTGCDIITVEIEDVNLKALYELEKMGKKVYPQPHILEIIKDKSKQKQYYRENDIPTSPFLIAQNKNEIMGLIEKGILSYPFVQKAATGGYDGRGVEVINGSDDIFKLMDTKSVLEDKVLIDKEIAIIVARTASGNIQSFPAVEMEFDPKANLVEFLFSPANLSDKQHNEAKKMAENLAEKLGIVGLLAVELFLDKNGNILINEVAPRPHNSGHHTIEACTTSQFEQHLRAILDLPLGDVSLNETAVMVNLLGENGYLGKAKYQGLADCLELKGVHPHIYGKEITKPSRKMGHVTICDKSMKHAMVKARFVKDNLKVIS